MTLNRSQILPLVIAALAATSASAAPVVFDWAQVGNAGNAADSRTGKGAVAYNYAIAKTEVTNAQYTEFLNAVAATDSFGGVDPSLYNNSMDLTVEGGITRSGAPGSYTYATKVNMANKPVNYVSFFDAMRFTNWLHNGQGPFGSPSGDTETGAYTIGSGVDEVRSVNAKFWLPSEDEWYKAAYHDASAGTADAYFDYATGSNSFPTPATASSVGDISNPGAGVVNYANSANWNGTEANGNGNVTTVGSAGPSSTSPYGTYDQNGNVFEWKETLFNLNPGDPSPTFRGLGGGSMDGGDNVLRPDFMGFEFPANEFRNVGFRVATVPEPSGVLLGALLAAALLMRRRV